MGKKESKVTWNRQNITAGFRICCYVVGSLLFVWIIVEWFGDDIVSILKALILICVGGVGWLITSVGNFFDRVEATWTSAHTFMAILIALLVGSLSHRTSRLEDRLNKQEQADNNK